MNKMSYKRLLLELCILLIVIDIISSSSFRLRTKRIQEKKSPYVKRTKRIEDDDSIVEKSRTQLNLLNRLKSDSSTEQIKTLIKKLIERIEERESYNNSSQTSSNVGLSTSKANNLRSGSNTTDTGIESTKTKMTQSKSLIPKDRSNRSPLFDDDPIAEHSEDITREKREPMTITSDLIKHPPEKQLEKSSNPGNDITSFRTSLYGFCRAQKLRQTFTAKGCENVTIETVVCGGVCQDALQTFHETEDVKKAFEVCKYCGPLEYEEKLIFMQCYKGVEKRRRWELRVRKMYVPKTCGCIKESCHKLNKTTGEGHQRL